MPRKRLPIFHKVSNLLRIPIVVAKIRKPIIPKLIFLRKSRKLKKFKRLKHYSYGFLEECLGGLKAEGGEVQYRLSMDRTLPAATVSNGEYLEPLDYLVEEEDSVDQRAERFIERFYQEMRLQRQESI